MAFLTEPEPPGAIALPITPAIRRMVAPNASKMTYHGTNSWIVKAPEGLWIIDPGPDHSGHITALAALGPVAGILLTHTHPDHLAGAPALKAATGAPLYGFRTPWAKGFTPDIALDEGDQAGPFTALHTPGHASDHLCFAWKDGVMFTGDHVMSWSTSMVSLPDGSMLAYMANLRRLLERNDTLYLGGHGPPLPQPAQLVRAMLSHRVLRENAILAALQGGALHEEALLAALYQGLDPALLGPARRVVAAHVGKLVQENRVKPTKEGAYEAV